MFVARPPAYLSQKPADTPPDTDKEANISQMPTQRRASSFPPSLGATRGDPDQSTPVRRRGISSLGRRSFDSMLFGRRCDRRRLLTSDMTLWMASRDLLIPLFRNTDATSRHPASRFRTFITVAA